MCYEFTHVTCKNAGKDIVFRRSQRCILPVAGAFCFEDLGFQTRSDLPWQPVFGQCCRRYCSLVTFREVFLWTKFTENPRIAARNHALHDFCASRSALLWTEWTNVIYL